MNRTRQRLERDFDRYFPEQALLSMKEICKTLGVKDPDTIRKEIERLPHFMISSTRKWQKADIIEYLMTRERSTK